MMEGLLRFATLGMHRVGVITAACSLKSACATRTTSNLSRITEADDGGVLDPGIYEALREFS